jgi:hypothetical protein
MTTVDNLASFRAAVDALAAEAALGDARCLTLVDPDFEDWALDSPALINALTDFVRRPGRRVALLARHYEHVRRHCPRFTAWRTSFGHAVDARVPETEQIDLPTALLLDRAKAVRIVDRRHWLGEVTDAAVEIHALGRQIDALLQRGEPGFASTTLGL